MTTPPQDPWSPQSPGSPQPGPEYQTPGYPAPGYPAPGTQPGTQPAGYPTPGYQTPGYQSPGYPVPEYQTPAYPTPAYPQGGFPTYPGGPAGGYPGGYPGGHEGATLRAKPTPPSTVRMSFWAWMLVLVVGIASSLMLFTTDYYDALDEALRGLDPGQVAFAAEFGRSVFMIFAFVGIAISLFIYLFFGFKMLAGRNWARIVLTILGGLTALSTAVSGGAASMSLNDVDVALPGSSMALGWLGAALAVVAIIAMFMPASNAYFSAVKAFRAGR